MHGQLVESLRDAISIGAVNLDGPKACRHGMAGERRFQVHHRDLVAIGRRRGNEAAANATAASQNA